ncbi:MAG: hypothetical protein NPIRA03_08420 [Nitrospirales bacterium]|nr:MAG: hypothetical protein NPIRA03_08420 [Nitrospirales bacterium]
MTGCQDPPIHELQKARQAVEHARREGALTFAPDPYSLAQSELTIGEEEFHEQSQKVFWARDYSMANRLMMLAQTDAHQALILTQEEKQKSSRSDIGPPPLLSVHSHVEGAPSDQRTAFVPGPRKKKKSSSSVNPANPFD